MKIRKEDEMRRQGSASEARVRDTREHREGYHGKGNSGKWKNNNMGTSHSYLEGRFGQVMSSYLAKKKGKLNGRKYI